MESETDRAEESQDYDPDTKPSDPLEAVKRAQRKAGVRAGHVTGRYGYDVTTELPVADVSSQPIQSAKDRIQQEREQEDSTE